MTWSKQQIESIHIEISTLNENLGCLEKQTSSDSLKSLKSELKMEFIPYIQDTIRESISSNESIEKQTQAIKTQILTEVIPIINEVVKDKMEQNSKSQMITIKELITSTPTRKPDSPKKEEEEKNTIKPK